MNTKYSELSERYLDISEVSVDLVEEMLKYYKLNEPHKDDILQFCCVECTCPEINIFKSEITLSAKHRYIVDKHVTYLYGDRIFDNHRIDFWDVLFNPFTNNNEVTICGGKYKFIFEEYKSFNDFLLLLYWSDFQYKKGMIREYRIHGKMFQITKDIEDRFKIKIDQYTREPIIINRGLVRKLNDNNETHYSGVGSGSLKLFVAYGVLGKEDEIINYSLSDLINRNYSVVESATPDIVGTIESDNVGPNPMRFYIVEKHADDLTIIGNDRTYTLNVLRKREGYGGVEIKLTNPLDYYRVGAWLIVALSYMYATYRKIPIEPLIHKYWPNYKMTYDEIKYDSKYPTDSAANLQNTSITKETNDPSSKARALEKYHNALKECIDKHTETVKGAGKVLHLEEDLETIARFDIAKYLMYLSASDGKISYEEAQIITDLCGFKMTPTEISRFIIDRNIYSVKFEKTPPYSLKISVEGDNYLLKKGNILAGKCSEMFIDLYKEVGNVLIRSDGFEDDNELEDYEIYITMLEKYREANYEGTQNDISPKRYSDYEKIEKYEEQTSEEIKKANGNNIWDELYGLIGLTKVKKEVRDVITLVNAQKRRADQGLNPVPVSKHIVFTGNPGTGKTSVARIIAKIYKEYGVLSKGQLVECDRADLVAGYVGQTAIKTREKIKEALGGVLFIDEAYTLAKNDTDFGQEAIDTILKEMEDNRDDFVVIVAGYPELMKKFVNSNPGLKSRFNKYINFEDYTTQELYDIFIKFVDKYDYSITKEALKEVEKLVFQMVKNKDERFANGREIRNLFERIITNQSIRCSENQEISNTITIDDIHLS